MLAGQVIVDYTKSSGSTFSLKNGSFLEPDCSLHYFTAGYQMSSCSAGFLYSQVFSVSLYTTFPLNGAS